MKRPGLWNGLVRLAGTLGILAGFFIAWSETVGRALAILAAAIGRL